MENLDIKAHKGPKIRLEEDLRTKFMKHFSQKYLWGFEIQLDFLYYFLTEVDFSYIKILQVIFLVSFLK